MNRPQSQIRSHFTAFRVHTLKLVPGVEDSHVGRYRVKSTAPDDVHTFVSCLTVVVKLHALQKLHTRHKEIHECPTDCITHYKKLKTCTVPDRAVFFTLYIADFTHNTDGVLLFSECQAHHRALKHLYASQIQ